MARDLSKFSTEQLEKKIRNAKIVIGVCWGAVFVVLAITIVLEKSHSDFAGNVGIIGLGVATIAMLIGIKQARKEITERETKIEIDNLE